MAQHCGNRYYFNLVVEKSSVVNEGQFINIYSKQSYNSYTIYSLIQHVVSRTTTSTGSVYWSRSSPSL
jgi:hypothetical protein